MDDLIDKLSAELKPVRPLIAPSRRMSVWMLGVVIYMLVIASVIHFRADLFDLMQSPVMVVEFVLALLMAFVSGYAAFCLCAPDGYGRRWPVRGAFLLLALLSALLLAMFILSPEPIAHAHLQWHECVAKSLAFFVVPIGALTYMASKGASTQPKLLLGMGILSVSSMGYIALRLTCPDDAALHTVIYHILPYIFIGFVSGLLAQRFLRW